MAKKPKAVAPAQELIDALKFVSQCLTENGTIDQTHCLIEDNYVTASNGIISMGHKLNFEFNCAPNVFGLINALSGAKAQFTITKLDNDNIAVKFGAANIIIKSIDTKTFKETYVLPDRNNIGSTNSNDDLMQSFKILSRIPKETEKQVLYSSIWLTGTSCTATDGKIMVECYHGANLPFAVLPIKSLQKILKIDKKIMQIGYSRNNITFYYEDQSWICSQFYDIDIPNYRPIVEEPSNPVSVRKDVFEGIELLSKFAKNDYLYFNGDKLTVDDIATELTSSFQLAHRYDKFIVRASYLLMMQDYIETIDFTTGSKSIMFFSSKLRGKIIGVT